jgi:hypothetical protein
MLKTGNAIAIATMPAAILPILYRITGTAMSTRQSIVNVIIMAVMTGMIAMTGMITVMVVVMVMAKTKVATEKEEINSAWYHRLTSVTDQDPHSAIQRRRLFFCQRIQVNAKKTSALI